MFNQTTVVGNLGQNPEMRYLPDGTAVTSLSVATNRSYTDQQTGEPVTRTTWYRVSVWGKQAEPCNQYLAKGRQVLVVGELQADPSTGGPRLFQRQDGTMGASFELRAQTVQFLGSPGGEATAVGETADTPAENDIPF